MYLISIHTNVDHSSRKTLSRKEKVQKGKHFKHNSFKQEKDGNENRCNSPVSISFPMNPPRRDIYQAVLNHLKRQFNSNCQRINVHQKHFRLKEYFFCSSFILIILQYHDWLIRLQFLQRNQRTLMLIAKTNKYTNKKNGICLKEISVLALYIQTYQQLIYRDHLLHAWLYLYHFVHLSHTFQCV